MRSLKKGVANFVVESDAIRDDFRPLAFDERLRRLSQMKAEGLINEAEFQQKRDELMNSQW